MKNRYIGLMILGVLIMVAGMGLYTYQAVSNGGIGGIIFYSYPYQTQGLILLVAGAGIFCVGLGFYIRNWKAESMVPK
jgi:hypothetical protein